MNDPDDSLNEYQELLNNLGNFAVQIRALFEAFITQGFTEEQAMELVIVAFKTMLEQNLGKS